MQKLADISMFESLGNAGSAQSDGRVFSVNNKLDWKSVIVGSGIAIAALWGYTAVMHHIDPAAAQKTEQTVLEIGSQTADTLQEIQENFLPQGVAFPGGGESGGVFGTSVIPPAQSSMTPGFDPIITQLRNAVSSNDPIAVQGVITAATQLLGDNGLAGNQERIQQLESLIQTQQGELNNLRDARYYQSEAERIAAENRARVAEQNLAALQQLVEYTRGYMNAQVPAAASLHRAQRIINDELLGAYQNLQQTVNQLGQRSQLPNMNPPANRAPSSPSGAPSSHEPDSQSKAYAYGQSIGKPVSDFWAGLRGK